MGLDEIATFVEAVEAGSLSAAARILSVPKSTVSRRLHRLEAEIGEPLVQRHARLFRLTEAGDVLYRRSAGAVRELQLAARQARGEAAGIRGELVITAAQDLGTSLRMMELLTEFRSLHPEVRLTVHPTDRLVDLVTEGFDFAFRAHLDRLVDSSALKVRRLGTLSTELFASPGYLAASGRPETPEDLDKHDMVMPILGQHGPVWLSLVHCETGETFRIQGTPGLRASSVSFLAPAAVAGAGIAPVPPFDADPLLKQGLLVRVLPGWSLTAGTLSVLWPGSRLPSPRRRAFLDHVLANVDRLIGGGPVGED